MADAVLRISGADVERSKTSPGVLEALAFFVEWEFPDQGQVAAAPMATRSPPEVWGRPLERGAVGGRTEPE